MPNSSNLKDFPEVSAKLSAPTKKSLFERQKAEAEAKRAREEAATAAVYEDFVKSFDDEASTPDRSGLRTGPSPGGYASGPGKRHFTSTTGRNSGPGSLGPVPSSRSSGPGTLGQSHSAFGRKRPFEETATPKRGHGMFSYNDNATLSAPRDAVSAFKSSDDDEDRMADSRAEDRAAAKPTIQLLSLPPGTSNSVIKALIPSLLSVDNIRITSKQAQGSGVTERNSSSAIVTLASETPASDIDTVVNSLQNRYLGRGYYLSISRHLSSAVASSLLSTPGAGGNTNLPFGAKPTQQAGSLNRAPPPNNRGFAPPTSYTPTGVQRSNGGSQVTVQPPNDLKQIKLIHKTLEALLTYGPEFEALLMSRPSVQRDEKWAWLWNARSSGGVYYRWRLWELVTSSGPPKNRVGGDGQVLFDRGAAWLPPDQNLRYEYTTEMNEFVSDSDYDSSDEEDDERRDQNVSEGQPDGNGFLAPIARAKLVHLLSRLPDTNARLRKGDVARITSFAIDNAGAGADEVVDLITANVVHPFNYTKANPEYERKQTSDEEDNGSDDDSKARAKNGQNKSPGNVDMTAASLVGLYIISDILSSSSTSGVRHAWRYRSLFETALKRRHVFETLGRADKELGWGKLKAEKWKRSVNSLLNMFEGWSVFPQHSQEAFVESFNNPPLSEAEKADLEREELRKQKAAEEDKKAKSRWKSVEDAKQAMADVDQEMKDVDGEDLDDEYNDEDTVLDDEALDGVPMVDSSEEEDEPPDAEALPAPSVEEPARQEPAPAVTTSSPKIHMQATIQQPVGRRQRPTAADMFADESDND
ncbi:hypothetical protein UCRPC4_g00406 [Phaeomoniella chlamydospora]|uniref:CID domain-containing protein n=1 Tax=Phaeomoniella chlamydospora TaxID=158046 RepID=A0A0G2F2U3_PHACM|nr:hypothetical protein UCRPC4_g00406 [Phaeomoniella chlamydospora]